MADSSSMFGIEQMNVPGRNGAVDGFAGTDPRIAGRAMPLVGPAGGV